MLLVPVSPAAVAAGVARQAIVYGYDSQNRRIGKAVYDYNPAGDATWQLTQSVKYLYDGYNLLVEMDAMPSTPTLVRAYAWGQDLSGTMQGAGGVGGLLMASLNDGNSTTQTVYYGYDGNGNVITLADTSGNVVANYDYDAFGNDVRATGYWARFNPVRFSTKCNETNGTYAGREVGLYLYPMRPYSPSIGRWLNRDKLGEMGGLNLNAFVCNDAVNHTDPLGLQEAIPEFIFDIAPDPVTTGEGGYGAMPGFMPGTSSLGDPSNPFAWGHNSLGVISANGLYYIIRGYPPPAPGGNNLVITAPDTPEARQQKLARETEQKKNINEANTNVSPFLNQQTFLFECIAWANQRAKEERSKGKCPAFVIYQTNLFYAKGYIYAEAGKYAQSGHPVISENGKHVGLALLNQTTGVPTRASIDAGQARIFDNNVPGGVDSRYWVDGLYLVPVGNGKTFLQAESLNYGTITVNGSSTQLNP